MLQYRCHRGAHHAACTRGQVAQLPRALVFQVTEALHVLGEGEPAQLHIWAQELILARVWQPLGHIGEGCSGKEDMFRLGDEGLGAEGGLTPAVRCEMH